MIPNSGHVRVYQYINNAWSKLGQDIDGEATSDQSGFSLSLSANGNIVAIGAINNDGSGNMMPNSGHVRVYQYINNAWSKLGQDIDGEASGDNSGHSVSLNAAGTILAIGAVYNYGNGTDSGHVRVYSAVTYYPTEADALANTNPLGPGTSYTVGAGGTFGPGTGYTSWTLASNSTGSSSQSAVYANGNTLNADGLYKLYPSAPCFLEGTTILCQEDGVEKYIPVEELKSGTLVKTSLDGYKPVVLIGKGTITNTGDDERIKNRLYKCSISNYPELKEDLYITGCHSILEFPITEKQKEETIKHLGQLFVTDKKYRLMAFLDERAEPWNSNGEYAIWHFALENTDIKKNYGVYANGGLLVESCSINFLKNKSNMIFKV
jgi:hypothetical protein